MYPPVETTELGSLDILDVYVSYDGLRLFSCKDSSGQVYVAVWVDESDASEVWLYAPVSQNRLTDLEAGTIDLHNIFTQTETGSVLQITKFHQPDHPRVEAIACSEIPPEWLPAQGSSVREPRDL